jgi:hypothetical protein
MRAGDKGDSGDFSPKDFIQLATVLEKVLAEAPAKPAFGCCVDVLITVLRPELRLAHHAGHALAPAQEPFVTLSGSKARSVVCTTCQGLLVGWAR